MGAAIRRLLLCAADDFRLHRRSRCPRSATLMLSLQPGDASVFESALPLRHGRCAGTQFPFNLPITQPMGERQNQASTEHISGSKRPRLRPSPQLFSLFFTDRQQPSIISHAMLDVFRVLLVSPGHATSAECPEFVTELLEDGVG